MNGVDDDNVTKFKSNLLSYCSKTPHPVTDRFTLDIKEDFDMLVNGHYVSHELINQRLC